MVAGKAGTRAAKKRKANAIAANEAEAIVVQDEVDKQFALEVAAAIEKDKVRGSAALRGPCQRGLAPSTPTLAAKRARAPKRPIRVINKAAKKAVNKASKKSRKK